MRLYYVDDLICNDEELTISLAFPFEAELTLKFPGGYMRRFSAVLLACLFEGPARVDRAHAATARPVQTHGLFESWGWCSAKSALGCQVPSAPTLKKLRSATGFRN